jgi:hypothetical protein
LIRPFGAFVLAALFPVTMLLSRLLRGESLLFRFSDYLIIVGLVGPCLGYLLWISSLPVWQDWSISSFHLSFITRKNLIGGFSVFWFFAIMGALRAFRERRLDMLIFCLWTFSTMLLLIGFGYRAYYVANGAVIAYGILAAFGLEHLLRHLAVYLTKYGQRGQAIFRNLGATAAALFMIGTSLCWYRMALDFETPRIDTEILAAAALIRQESANSIPIVLTDCSTASALPGLAAARVYSGHYGLTHDFSARCRELRLGGFEDEERSSPAPSFDESRLRDIVAKIKPDFVLIRRGASAEQWLLAHHAAASANMTGQRWSLLVAGK